MAAKVPPFSELIAATATSAVHLEMRDAYTPDDQRYVAWLAGQDCLSPPILSGRLSCGLVPHARSDRKSVV